MRLRISGMAMALGGLLFIIRIMPIVALKPENIAFPPQTTDDLLNLADAVGIAWPISHALGLVGAALIIFGYWRQGEALAGAGMKIVGRSGAIFAFLAFGLFAVALVIDGFFLYQAIRKGDGMERVEDLHDIALMFFAPAMLGMFVAMLPLTIGMISGSIHSRWLGAFGMLIAALAIAAYISGLAGPRWDHFQVGGSSIMAGFIWHIAVGIAGLFGRGLRR